MFDLFEPEIALHWAGRIAGIGSLIAWTELFASARTFTDASIRSWPLSWFRATHPSSSRSARVLDRVLGYPGVLAIAAIGWMAALVLVMSNAPGRAAGAASAIVVLCHFIFRFRGLQGSEGADPLYTTLLIAVAWGELSGSPSIAAMCVIFIAAQAALAYAGAGGVKLISPAWRDGSAMTGILRTRQYGHEGLAAMCTARPGLAHAAGLGTIVFECLMPLAMFAPPPVLLVFLAAGLVFHAGIAGIMGLGSFLWAFVATYPALIYVSLRLWHDTAWS
jgi:hypothetical protein